MDCLDANLVQDLMSGALDGTLRAHVLGHLDTCEDCRQLLNVTASDTMNESLPRFHDNEEIGLDTTAIAEGVPAKPPTNKGVSLLETQLASDAVNDVGEAPTIVPQDLVTTPALAPRGADRPPLQGRRLAHYTLTERLGAGAMGVVWKADDPKLGRQVAVKVLRRYDEALTERLVREARSMAQVNHPNVVTVYEVGEGEDGTTFISMELVSGQSLRAWQTKERRSVPEIVETYIAAGRGLAAAHAAGIIHRDFKPDNVLIGDDGRVRVTDFGLAAAKPTAIGEKPTHIGDVNLTTSGSVLGTPAYMAPEQFMGGNVDPRTDQFNFCVALHEALYGERPFEGKTFAELGDNVCEGTIKPAPAGSQVSSALREILLRGLSAKPGDRFPTMNDLIVELGRDRARPWRRTAIAATALAGVLSLGLVADWVVRDRVSTEIRQSFALMRSQLDKTIDRQTTSFYNLSDIAYEKSALRELAAHHDQADFGLGNPEDDKADLEALHGTLASADWAKLEGTQIVIGDYKGRLMYTSAAPTTWGGDLKVFDPVKRALESGKFDSVLVLSYRDPRVASSGLLGPGTPPPGLGALFERTLALGSDSNEGREARAIYMQLLDGKQLVEEIQLDRKTGIALVAPDGMAIANDAMRPELIGYVSENSDEIRVAGRTYLVQAIPVRGLDGAQIARVVMARPLDSVLSLFPGARLVLALTAFAALVLAAFTWWRARQITGARV